MDKDDEKIGETEENYSVTAGTKFTKKNIVIASIIFSFAIVVGIFVFRWYLLGLTHVYTEDAEINGHLISVSTMVPGNIKAVYVHKNESVKKGEFIARIDDSAYYPAMLQARAYYKLARAKLFSAGADIAGFIGTNYNSFYLSKLAYKMALADLGKAKLTYELHRRDYKRDLLLLKKEFITKQQFDSVRTAYLVSKQAYLAAVSALGTAKRNYFQSSYMKNNIAANNLTTLKPLEANVKIAKAAYEVALADYKNTFIRSPINGVVAKEMSYIGEYVTPGTPIIIENNLRNVWVTANVKETVIENIKRGDPVKIIVDSFPGRVFNGRVEFVGSVSTSKFALIPTNNPSGTFTKVTHRLPVRIKILNDYGHILKPGMMVEVTISTAKIKSKDKFVK
ncbi:HlyD family secretion protein [Candidatus Acidulodesulfobacterium sp. H_13]|uniref:HlyD family secretion protein n=1 Tax=Candidatus Acidulodesulfobacterium sp. H_13 TaxID=3395470 RepID=UPI003AF6A1F1